MIRLLPLILIAALLAACSKANSKRIRTLQLSGATVVAFAELPLPISPASTPASFPNNKEASAMLAAHLLVPVARSYQYCVSYRRIVVSTQVPGTKLSLLLSWA